MKKEKHLRNRLLLTESPEKLAESNKTAFLIAKENSGGYHYSVQNFEFGQENHEKV